MLASMAFPTHQELRTVLEPLLHDRGLDIEEIKVNRAGKKSAIALLVDSSESSTGGELAPPPSLEEVERVANDVSVALDQAEERGELRFGSVEYTLEVSTPGVDRPLTKPRHWRRNRGRAVSVDTADGSLKGRIGPVSDDGTHVMVMTRLTKKQARERGVKAGTLEYQTLKLGEVPRAVVEIEFAQPPAEESQLAALTYDEAQAWREDNK